MGSARRRVRAREVPTNLSSGCRPRLFASGPSGATRIFVFLLLCALATPSPVFGALVVDQAPLVSKNSLHGGISSYGSQRDLLPLPVGDELMQILAGPDLVSALAVKGLRKYQKRVKLTRIISVSSSVEEAA